MERIFVRILFPLLIAGCTPALRMTAAPGLPRTLAQRRAGSIHNLRYQLRFEIGAKIRGEAVIRFDLSDVSEPVILDFRAPKENLLSASAPYEHGDGHISFRGTQGPNEFSLSFIVQETSVHREPDYLYTLFVPDRASEAFPCFDQPDLKARYALTLDMPAGWSAVANAALARSSGTALIFEETRALSTYHFAFAAGRFQTLTAPRDARSYRMLHLPEDSPKAAAQAEEIFDLHAKSMAWLEEYTSIPYPWDKFDFVLIPSFPYRGI